MVASAGLVIQNTKPAILGHAPVGAATDSYDFDGQPARIYKIKINAFRTAAVSHFVYLAIPGFGNVNLAAISGESVANAGTDGELISDEINMCLDVPAGSTVYWVHGTSFWSFLMMYDIRQA